MNRLRPLMAWVFVCVYSVSVLSCVGSGLASGWSPIDGVLPTKIKKLKWNVMLHEYLMLQVGGTGIGWTDGYKVNTLYSDKPAVWYREYESLWKKNISEVSVYYCHLYISIAVLVGLSPCRFHWNQKHHQFQCITVRPAGGGAINDSVSVCIAVAIFEETMYF
jgi:hypothetical protein